MPLPVESVVFPGSRIGPGWLLAQRFSLALLLMAVCTAVVYLERDGYRDANGGAMSVLDCLYYSTVSLSTTGYGDIVPVSPAARLVNIVVITPLRLGFILLLVGTTLEVLTTTARAQSRARHWRRTVRDHTVIVGYGTKGRAAAYALRDGGTPFEKMIVIDPDPLRVAQATEDGTAGLVGDATLLRVLRQAEVGRATRVMIATERDDTSVLACLTVRRLTKTATVVVAIRQRENEELTRTAGADSVVVYADTAGRLLGVSALSPATGDVATDLLSAGSGLELVEREATATDVGSSVPATPEILLGILREGRLYKYGEHVDGQPLQVREGDRLVAVRNVGNPVGHPLSRYESDREPGAEPGSAPQQAR
jgi:voltage-gated potassium channel